MIVDIPEMRELGSLSWGARRTYWDRWHEELQQALGEVQLLATSHVADLADRMSGALMELTSLVEPKRVFTQYYPTWFQAQDLLHVRDAMRVQLGLKEMEAAKFPRSGDWPSLSDRSEREAHIQDHRHRQAGDAQQAPPVLEPGGDNA